MCVRARPRDSVLCITRTHMQFSLSRRRMPRITREILIIVCFRAVRPLCLQSHSNISISFLTIVRGWYASVYVFIIYRRLLLVYASAAHMHLLYAALRFGYCVRLHFIALAFLAWSRPIYQSIENNANRFDLATVNFSPCAPRGHVRNPQIDNSATGVGQTC